VAVAEAARRPEPGPDVEVVDRLVGEDVELARAGAPSQPKQNEEVVMMFTMATPAVISIGRMVSPAPRRQAMPII
jgi:hypothetical protein